MLHKNTIQDGTTVDWFGPTAAEIRKVLDRAGHKPSQKGATPSAAPSVGYVVTKPREVAYVEVGSTMPGYGIDSYRRALTAAGYIVRDNTWRADGLVVFSEPRNRDQNGKLIRARG